MSLIIAMPLLLQGFIIGFLVAIPIGPFGIIGLKRVFYRGPLSSLYSGGGIATGFGIWVFIILQGFTLISGFILKEEFWLRLIGSIFIFLVGLRALVQTTDFTKMAVQRRNRVKEFLLTFVPVLTSPATFITFSVIFTFLGLARLHLDASLSFWIAFSVFSGALILWTMIGITFHFVKNRLHDHHFVWLNKITSLILIILSFSLIIGL
ncbi:MAG: hypothetical protein GF313_17565 [Caldithrix sp.]|nr:hypothetical protein [Caldithrix sp.]